MLEVHFVCYCIFIFIFPRSKSLDSAARNLKHVLHIYLYVCADACECVYTLRHAHCVSECIYIYIDMLYIHIYYEYYCTEYILGRSQHCLQPNSCPLKVMESLCQLSLIKGEWPLTDSMTSCFSRYLNLHVERMNQNSPLIKRQRQIRTCSDDSLKSSHDASV